MLRLILIGLMLKHARPESGAATTAIEADEPWREKRPLGPRI